MSVKAAATGHVATTATKPFSAALVCDLLRLLDVTLLLLLTAFPPQIPPKSFCTKRTNPSFDFVQNG